MPDDLTEAEALKKLWASCANQLSWALIADRPRLSMVRIGDKFQIEASGVGVIRDADDEDAALRAVFRFQLGGGDLFQFHPALLDRLKGFFQKEADRARGHNAG